MFGIWGVPSADYRSIPCAFLLSAWQIGDNMDPSKKNEKTTKNETDIRPFSVSKLLERMIEKKIIESKKKDV